MKNSKVGIGLIGYGYWGPNYARILSNHKNASLNWVCDLNGNLLLEARRKYQTKITSDYKHVLEDEEVSAVIISTPLTVHYKLIKEALNSNKHVLVEKPFVATLEQAKELTNLAIKKKRKLMVAHTFLYNDNFIKLLEIVRAGDLGDIRYITCSRTNLGPIRNDVDVIWDLAPHDLSMIYSLVESSPSKVYVSGESYLKNSQPDVAIINMNFKKNILANIIVSWLSPIKSRSLAIIGSKKMAIFDDTLIDKKLKIYEMGVTVPPRGADFQQFMQFGIYQGKEYSPNVIEGEPLNNQLDHFVDCILNNKEPISNGKSSQKIVQWLEACERSFQTGIPVEIKKYD